MTDVEPRASLLAPGPHGGDGPRLAAALGVDPAAILDLSQSLNPAAPDPAAFVRAHLDRVRHYPDDRPARAALAAALGVDEANVVLTNGGSEAITLVARLHPRGWVDEPDFSLYRRHLTELDPAAPRWRSNPHNPSGRLAAPDETAGIWDEAFYPLATGTWTRGDHLRGAITVGSLTKVFACPGLRLGYVLAPEPELADRLRVAQPEWAVNSIALAVLPDLLEAADLPSWARAIRAGRADLVALLTGHDLAVADTDANWVLVTEPGFRERLLPHGIVVRDCESFGMEGVFRVAVPDSVGLERLAAALDTRADG